MGNLHEWMEVVFTGGLWGLSMVLCGAPGWRFSVSEHPVREWLWQCISVTAASLLFGILMTFPLRMFHGRLAVILAIAVIITLTSSFFPRRARKDRAAMPCP